MTGARFPNDVPSAFVLADVSFPGGHRGELAVVDGLIVAAPPVDAPRHDASEYVVLPRLVESHVHLDKTFIGGPWMPHRPADTLLERIESEVTLLDSEPGDPRIDPVATRAVRLIEGLAKIAPGRPEPLTTAYSVALLAYTQTLDIGAAKAVLGWTPRIGFEEGLARTFEAQT